MISIQKMTKAIMKRNITVALIVSTVSVIAFFLWLGNYISRESFKTYETLSKSFQNIVDTLSNIILLNEEEINMHINSGLTIAKQLLENGNYSNINEIKKIYQFSLSKKFVDVDILISDKEGSIIAATGYYSNFSSLNFKPVEINNGYENITEQYPQFLSFVGSTKRLALHTWVKFKDNFIVFAFYINPDIYENPIKSFTANQIGNIKDIAIYINDKTRLDTSQTLLDNNIYGLQSEKIIRQLLKVTFYKKFILSKYGTITTPLYLRITMEYFNYLYIGLLFVLVFVGTMLIFTYTSSKSSVGPFIEDLEKLDTAVREIGNTGILPPAGTFALSESQEFYETLSSILEELSATMEELEATNEELERAYNDINKKSEEFKKLLLNISERLAIIAEGYDENTGQHIFRVKLLSGFIAEKLGLDEETIEKVRMFASLHDIGKIFVPKEILQKPGKLTAEEWEIMRQHTIYAKRILDVPGFESALNIALYHHENYDGTGYPFGLKEKEIPVEAHIVKLVDVYDALRSSRPYKKGFTHEETINIILNGDGRTSPEHFDPKLLEVFKEYEADINRLWESIK